MCEHTHDSFQRGRCLVLRSPSAHPRTDCDHSGGRCLRQLDLHEQLRKLRSRVATFPGNHGPHPTSAEMRRTFSGYVCGRLWQCVARRHWIRSMLGRSTPAVQSSPAPRQPFQCSGHVHPAGQKVPAYSSTHRGLACRTWPRRFATMRLSAVAGWRRSS